MRHVGKDHKLELLHEVPLFAKLHRRALERIGLLTDEIDVGDAYVLMREGDPGQEFFILLAGRVRVSGTGNC